MRILDSEDATIHQRRPCAGGKELCSAWHATTHSLGYPLFVFAHLQKAKEDVSHAAKKAAISAETSAESTKHEAKGFGARLWGRGQVSMRQPCGKDLLHHRGHVM